MAQLVVTWSVKALRHLDEKALWYLANRNETYAKTFAEDVRDCIEILSAQPSIGVIRKQTPRYTYRIFHNHPQCSIYYWHTSSEVHIIDLLFTRMQRHDLD